MVEFQETLVVKLGMTVWKCSFVGSFVRAGHSVAENSHLSLSDYLQRQLLYRYFVSLHSRIGL